MANSRDVRLTIRARDEASKIIAKVGEALNQYANGTDKVGKSLTPLKGKLDSAVKSVSDLQTTMAKTSGQLGVNRNYQIITESLAKMKVELGENKVALQQNSEQLSKSKAAIEVVRKSRDDLRKSLSDEKKELIESSRAVNSYTKALASAEEQSRELTAEILKKENALQKSRADLEKSTAAQREAEVADQRAIRTTDVLTERITQLRAAREAERRTLTGAQGMTSRTERVGRIAQATNDPWASMAARSFQEDEGDVRSRLVAYDREIQRVEGLREAAKRAQQETSRNLTQQAQATREISRQMVSADNLGTLRAKLAQVQGQIAEHTQKLTGATVAQDRLTASVAKSEQALTEQNAEIQIAQNDIQKLDAENRALSNSVDRGTAAIEKSTVALNELQAEAQKKGFGKLGTSVDDLEKRLARLQQRYNQTADVLSRAGRYADGGGNFTGSEDAAKLRKLNEELRRAQDDSAAFKNEIKELNAAIARGDGGRNKMKADIRALAQAMGAAESDARQLTVRIREVGIASGSMRANIFDVWRKHNQDSRTALNLYQRIRGQVLSLIAAYGGLYGVARGIESVSQAFMTQEAALSRLGVVFDGNQSRMGIELDWIRRQAQRLGIEFGVLSQEYTKFAVGAAASGFSDNSIREIFLSVAEAGRVNKLSLEDIQGTFLALSQMIGKSKISAEELRQQLGERLPGAVRIVADALGMTIAELDKAMKAGEVFASEDNMLKIAAELNRVFGQQLPSSLRTFSAEWGRLQNTMFQSRVLIGRGGVIDALSDAMRRLNEFANSEEGVEFFLALGAAMGEVVSYVPTLIENFESIVKVLKVVMTIGVAAVFRRWMLALAPLGASLGATLLTLARAPSAFMVFNASLMASSSAMGAAGIAARGLGAALMTLGPLMAGLFIGSQIIGLFSSWSSGVDQIVEAQSQHERIMDSILQQYDEAKGKTYDWRDAINEKNRVELANHLPDSLDAYEEAQRRMSSLMSFRDADQTWRTSWMGEMRDWTSYVISNIEEVKDQYNLTDDLVRRVQESWGKVQGLNPTTKGGIDITSATEEDLISLRNTLEEFAMAVPDSDVRKNILATISTLDTLIATGNDLSLVINVMRDLGYTVDDNNNVVGRFGQTIEEAADSTSGASAELEKFKDQVETQLIVPLEEALREAGAFEEGFTDLDKVIESPFDGGKRSIRELLTTLDTLKNKVPEIAKAFQSLADDNSILLLEQRLGWIKNLPGMAGIFDRLIGDQIGNALKREGQTTQDFEATVGTSRGMQLEEIVVAATRVAERLGISATDLITTFGYETGGTYDPWQAGPTTQWGQHRGLIQWGEPQAAEFGVSAASTIEEQIDAVGRYLEQRGVRPGMGLLEIYAAINGGDVSAIGATDENNGGAPGTVRDKVYSQSMADHRANAEALLEIYSMAADKGERLGDEDKEAAKEAERAAKEAERAAKARAEEYDSLNQSLDVARLRANEQDREAFILERINQFRERHGELSEEELANLRKQYGLLYDMQEQKSADEQRQEKIKEHQEAINRLETQRNALIEQREYYRDNGDIENVEEINGELVGINSQLTAAIDNFIAFWKAVGGPESIGAIAQLEAMRLQLKKTEKEAESAADKINEKFASGLSDAFGEMVKAIASGENAWASFRDAFMSFASDFLIEIGKMIIKQTIFNYLSGLGGGDGGFGGIIMGGLQSLTGGLFTNVTTGLFHTGKGPGAASTGMRRTVPSALFSGAPRFHQGKLPGLRQGEMAAIINEEEEVLPPDDPRHAWNLGNSGGDAPAGGDMGGATIVNAFDAESFLEAGLASPRGRKLFTNFVRANKSVIKGALE